MNERAAALLDAAHNRSLYKTLGAELDAAGPELKRAVAGLARARGVDLPDDAETWPGKKLLRRARGLDALAQVRKNPIRRDEAFTCVRCGASVPPHGRSARDHCPFCLAGLHVDGDVPGDRASDCGGLLEPVAVHREKGRWILEYRCQLCGATRRNQVLLDGEPPDDWARVSSLAGAAG
ncbi:MAG: RNHCP domain-containing protein [Alphaproteobacteria bacterium]|nr:RNHCP domain-containing protein [Alphaproteobacteria bacterium]